MVLRHAIQKRRHWANRQTEAVQIVAAASNGRSMAAIGRGLGYTTSEISCCLREHAPELYLRFARTGRRRQSAAKQPPLVAAAPAVLDPATLAERVVQRLEDLTRINQVLTTELAVMRTDRNKLAEDLAAAESLLTESDRAVGRKLAERAMELLRGTREASQ